MAQQYIQILKPVGHFGSNLQPRSGKMKLSLRNRLSELKFIIIGEISMIFNNLLFYDHLRLNEIFGTVNDKPFAGISVITVGDIFQFPQVGGKACICGLSKEVAKF